MDTKDKKISKEAKNMDLKTEMAQDFDISEENIFSYRENNKQNGNFYKQGVTERMGK
ncbi:hypothetical protein SAMN05661008_01644 [Alkalithermobacter thermoalcaliphilus JW-YL-7 = DSM 7308]|uniref:Uncharacterized protein n=1 Tax=Alkalithermobacter thermoalcaliphilus JW-YL-7 = DSM 7308 TaxID=1121328 RepID=A0A150FSM9_CLOPD|nr:hypothetical protein JWYL7_1698 [[Clostridium] paradoxum JW-YL-7 = DSM 7308]SHL19641.1 hypothetical protein SAMN05661008_01644 [[Clostridium] paradoxum JW-YL-7 = DSM 7308]